MNYQLRAVFLFFFTCSFIFSNAQTSSSKGKLFIIGGGEKPASMIKRIIKEADMKPGGYAVILPMSSEDPGGAISGVREQFGEEGLTQIYGAMFTKDQLNDQKKLDSVSNAGLIYISGGDQTRFMKLVEGTKLEKAIYRAFEKGTLIAGTSAGAAMMSEIMITGNQLKDTSYKATFKTIAPGNIETKKGLGLLKNVVIDQHFVIRSRHNRLITAILQFPETVGIGIDESTAILVKGNEVEVVGMSQVLVFRNPEKSQKSFDGKYGARGLILDIYLPGEKFKIGK